ncbi:hypothetical protein PR048_014000 [Dryococelus australis]|uniref:Uncharacterized protein n=1 Tax=Dryococelus australis TaxID=614101 RepID=A0ABQ9HU88_9NEOP|nr:hypothetical protein PR048_014000 [Dryococelus australis]
MDMELEPKQRMWCNLHRNTDLVTGNDMWLIMCACPPHHYEAGGEGGEHTKNVKTITTHLITMETGAVGLDAVVEMGAARIHIGKREWQTSYANGAILRTPADLVQMINFQHGVLPSH